MQNNYSEFRLRLLDKLIEHPNPIEILNKFSKFVPQEDIQSSTEVDIFTEVEAAGIPLNSTLKDRIDRCSIHVVRHAIDEYKEESQQQKIDNPGGKFYRILERISNGFRF